MQRQTRPFQVGTAQINTAFSGLNYFPYSVGVLQAYAQAHLSRPESCEFLVPLYTRLPVERAVDHMLSADVAAFSVYVWNEQISLYIARELKKRKPEVLVIFGGPQVLDRPEEIEGYLRKHSFIDLTAHGEGEKIFTAILEHLPERNWSEVPGVSYLTPDGRFVQHSRPGRFKDLSEIPSPYLTGVFDKLLTAHPEERWIPIWETNRGCPFSCTFCGWGGAVASKVNRWGLERLFAEVDWFADHDVAYISCADANFGIFPQDVEITKYVAKVKRERNCFPNGFSVQSTKNATERVYEIQKLLSDGGLNRGVVLSMQSLDANTLRLVKRDNIKLTTYEELQRRFRRDRVETMTDLILGLPGETYNSFANGVATLIQAGQHNRIQFNNLCVLPDAEMWDLEYRRRYGMETVRTEIVNIHGYRTDFAEVPEYQPLVIATESMPRPDWVRARALAWTAGLLHFDKVLQIPLVLAHELSGLSYRELLELCTLDRADLLSEAEFPTLAEIRDFFRAKAEDIQGGGQEYCHSAEWLDIWWPADEYMMIKLCTSGRLPAFYREALAALEKLLPARACPVEPTVLTDAARLNQALVKMPFQTEDLEVEMDWNILEFWNGVLVGETAPLVAGRRRYRIDRTTERWSSWEEWCRQVVWFGNKRGAYLYGNAPLVQFAGHF